MLAKVDVIGCQGNRGCHMNKDAPIIKNSNMTTSRITGVKILFEKTGQKLAERKKIGDTTAKNWRKGWRSRQLSLLKMKKKIVDKKKG